MAVDDATAAAEIEEPAPRQSASRPPGSPRSGPSWRPLRRRRHCVRSAPTSRSPCGRGLPWAAARTGERSPPVAAPEQTRRRRRSRRRRRRSSRARPADGRARARARRRRRPGQQSARGGPASSSVGGWPSARGWPAAPRSPPLHPQRARGAERELRGGAGELQLAAAGPSRRGLVAGAPGPRPPRAPGQGAAAARASGGADWCRGAAAQASGGARRARAGAGECRRWPVGGGRR